MLTNLSLFCQIIPICIVFTFIIGIVNILLRIGQEFIFFYKSNIRSCQCIYTFTLITSIYLGILIISIIVNNVINL